MSKKLQKGIYYQKKLFQTTSDSNYPSNDCFAIIFLRISNGVTAYEVKESLNNLWKMYEDLGKGKVRHLPNCLVPSGDLSVLIGYGPNVFSIPEVTRKIPRDFKDKQFLTAVAGGPIVEGSGIRYANDLHQNLGATEHIVVQCTSKTQLATYRAVVETWKNLSNIDSSKRILNFTTFFTGFQRDDGRSWLGFHDEVSNMRDLKERKKVIAIGTISNDLLHRDFWTAGGTYMAYLRIEIDLGIWEKIGRKQQEIIVGRDKLTGIPLMGIDKEGNPVIRNGCLTASQIRYFDKRFHDHPDYFHKPKVSERMKAMIDENASIRFLSQSHIGRTRHIDHIDSGNPTSRRIFRQGFEFIEPLYNNPSRQFRAGLNFISFQNDPSRLFFILTDPNWLGKTNFGGTGDIQEMTNFLSALAVGIFFIPPIEKPFPGASIFQ
jgi:Dyp-type peroxidase family